MTHAHVKSHQDPTRQCVECGLWIQLPDWIVTKNGPIRCEVCLSDGQLIDCEDCSGEGGHEAGRVCNGGCDWCGGCFDYIECSSCRGAGMVCVEDDEEEEEEYQGALPAKGEAA